MSEGSYHSSLGERVCEVLLVEDNEDHAALIIQYIKRHGSAGFTLTHVSSLKAALDALENSGKETHAVLLDLGLPDSEITETLDALASRYPNLPIVVLTSLNDIEFASKSVQQGAQDFLVKSQLNGDILLRSLTYAIERKRYAVALEESNAELRRFASTVAHEIRSPISVVHSCLEIVSRRHRNDFNESTAKIVDETLQRVSSVSELIDDLLRFARVEPGSNFKLFSAEACVREAIAACRKEISLAGASISYQDLPEVLGDSNLIRQVFQNLFLNAIKYCDRVPDISVSAKEEGDCFVFSVSDNGVGIDVADVEDVFKIFKTVDGVKKTSGSGIGLSLSKRIVEHHQGEMWLESKTGEGSRFCFKLPKEPSKEPENSC